MSVGSERQHQGLETLCFVIAVIVNFVDNLWQFTNPVAYSYGIVLGADIKMIALFSTARGLGGVLSMIWMPWMADGPKGSGQSRRRPVLLFSLFGCSMGYFLQGLAGSVNPGAQASHVCLLGRFVTGLFSGMGPVLSAYITEISHGDEELLRSRFKVLGMSNNVLGMCLSPLAGVLGGFSLQLPFYVATSMGVVALMIAVFSFTEASDLVKTSASESASPQSRPSRGNEKAISESNPCCDPAIWLMAIAAFCIVMIVDGFTLLTPSVISQPSFGIQGKTEKMKQQHVAAIVGFVGFPVTITMMLSTAFLYQPIMRRYSEISIIFISGFGLACAISAYGVIMSVWQVVVVNIFAGLCLGLVIPCNGVLVARYVSKFFPTQQNSAQGIPGMVGQMAILIAVIILADVISDFGIPLAGLFMGMCCLTYTICLCMVCAIEWWSETPKLRENQEKLLVASDPEKGTSDAANNGMRSEQHASERTEPIAKKDCQVAQAVRTDTHNHLAAKHFVRKSPAIPAK